MNFALQPGQLARLIDRLRFASEFRLRGAASHSDEKIDRLISQAENHLLALNHRAFRALPETALPEPTAEFQSIAQHFSEGRTDEALASALEHCDANPNARSWANTGDLQLLHGQIDQAQTSYRQAEALLGPLPPIRLRLGRVEASRGNWQAALRQAIGALSDNPLYGSARYLYWEAQRSLGRQAIYLPLPTRVVFGATGERLYMEPLSQAARQAWRSWAEVDEQLGLTESPPRHSAFRALTESWRKHRPSESQEDYVAPGIDGDVQLDLLQKWADADLLVPYLWAIGLGKSNAESFRVWHREHKASMTRFWEAAILSSDDVA